MKKWFMFLLSGSLLMMSISAPANAEPQAKCVRMAILQIKPGQLDAFRAIVREGMETALRVEPGVVALYSMADANDPHKLTFFELYVDDEAYEAHRATPHFKKYIRETEDMVAGKALIQGLPFEMHDKHNTPGAVPVGN